MNISRCTVDKTLKIHCKLHFRHTRTRAHTQTRTLSLSLCLSLSHSLSRARAHETCIYQLNKHFDTKQFAPHQHITVQAPQSV